MKAYKIRKFRAKLIVHMLIYSNITNNEKSETEQNTLKCWFWGSEGSGYEESSLLGCNVMQV
jgi:hypothetical protein